MSIWAKKPIFFYSTYSLFKTINVKLSILHYISLKYQIFLILFIYFYFFTDHNYYPLFPSFLNSIKVNLHVYFYIIYFYDRLVSVNFDCDGLKYDIYELESP